MKRSIINTITKFSYILCLLTLIRKTHSQNDTTGSYTLEFLLIKSTELPKAGEQHEIVTTITYTDSTMVIENSQPLLVLFTNKAFTYQTLLKKALLRNKIQLLTFV